MKVSSNFELQSARYERDSGKIKIKNFHYNIEGKREQKEQLKKRGCCLKQDNKKKGSRSLLDDLR